jgi:hypothetical protein
MSWEQTDSTIKSGHRNPLEFQEGTQKTVTLNEKEGIQAIIAKPVGKQTMAIQSYLFSKTKGWTLESAKAWFNKLHNPAKEHLRAVFPFTVAEKIVDKPLRIQGLAMTIGMSRNFNIYTPQELEAFSAKLVDAPVYLEHVTAEEAVGKVIDTQWDGQNLSYTAEIYDQDTADKIRNGLIRHVSVGADYQTLDLVNGKVPHGLYNAEMSLVAVPGIPETNIQILEKLKEQQYEPILSGEYTLGFYQDAAAFMPEHFSTVWLDRQDGVLAIMGKPRNQPDTQLTQAIYFSQTKLWDENKIHDWLSLHPTYTVPVADASPQIDNVVECIIRKPSEPTVPINQVIHMIEEVIPSHLVRRSWSLGPQRMCQELRRVVFKLRSLQENNSHKLTASN